MRFRTIDVRFPYVATFIPERRRKARTTVLAATATAALKCVDAEEARIAFRILYTERDAWIFLHPRKQLQGNTSRFVREATTLALIEYGGSIWWPLAVDDGYCYPGPIATDAECVEWMSSGYAFWYREGASAHVSRDASVRGFVEDGHDAALADVLRQVNENLLVCGSQWYVRGGVPAFLKRPYRSGKVWEIDVADPGPDRVIGDAGAFTASLRNSRFNNEAFRSSFVWSPSQYQAASCSAHPMQPEIPRIEVLMPELVADCRAAIRVDALLRRALEMFEDLFSTSWDAPVTAGHRDGLTEAACATGNDADITSRRVRALEAFFAAHPSDGNCFHLADLRMNFRSFLEDSASSQLTLSRPLDQSRMALAPEDEEALRSLAGSVCR
jgi:hypothetical protein